MWRAPVGRDRNKTGEHVSDGDVVRCQMRTSAATGATQPTPLNIAARAPTRN